MLEQKEWSGLIQTEMCKSAGLDLIFDGGKQAIGEFKSSMEEPLGILCMILEEITSFISNTGYLSYQTKALVLKHKHTPGPLEGSLEYTSWGFTFRVSESECLEWRPRICTSTVFQMM